MNKRQRKKFWKKNDAKFRKEMRAHILFPMPLITQETLQRTMDRAMNQPSMIDVLRSLEQ